jgi:cytosine/adenosine deaminase-related metal-dependent hydrolase
MRGALSIGANGGCPHVPESLVESVDSMEKDSVRLIEKYHDPANGAMIRIGLAPCWLVFETKDMLREARRIAEQYAVSLHSHLADSRSEYNFSLEKHGCSPTEFADKMGYLKEGNFFAHCIQLSRSDIALIAKNKVGISYCPTSDMLLHSGVAKIAEFLRRGIPVGIGVDGAASNNLSNLVAEIKSAYLIQQGLEIQREKEMEQQNIRNTKNLTPEDILYISTAGGAKVLGRIDIGHLAPGMMADFVILNWSKLSYAGGKHDPVAAIVLSGDARMIDHVFVNGKQVVTHGSLSELNEEKTAEYINHCSMKLFARYRNRESNFANI